MSKRTVYTKITPLPAAVTRRVVLEMLHNHTEMIDLNPLVEERHPIKAPGKATAEEFHATWYALTDRISYLPGIKGKVSYTCCFHDLGNGLQTHCYAPLGVDIKGKWTIGGSLPGEPAQPVEMGVNAPLSGLYLREDVDLRCNIMTTSFVKKQLLRSHEKLVDRLLVKAQLSVRSGSVRSGTLGQPSELDHGSTVSSPHPSFVQMGSPDPRYSMVSSQGPLSPGLPTNSSPGHSPYQQHDGRTSYYGSPGLQSDPGYQQANPYFQQGPAGSFRQEHSLSELSDSVNNNSTGRDAKSPFSGGPPVHQTTTGLAPVELPAEFPTR